MRNMSSILNIRIMMTIIFIPFLVELSWLPQEPSTTDIIKLIFDANSNGLSIEQLQNEYKYFQNIISNSPDNIKEVLKFKGNQNGQLVAFKMQSEDCFTIYGIWNDTAATPIYCVMIKARKGSLRLYQKSTFKQKNIRQILSLSDTTLAILLDDTVELIDISNNAMKTLQRLPLIHPTRMTAGYYKNVTYLAVISDIKANTLHKGAIEIYRSYNSCYFEHEQTLDCVEPKEIAFSHFNQIDDLLLFVLTATAEQPLIIYQYKGVVGFEKYIGTSTLPVAKHMEIIEIKSDTAVTSKIPIYLIALLGQHEITFLQIVFKTF